MKKFYNTFFLLCAFLTMLFFSNMAEASGRIIFIPIDNRPISIFEEGHAIGHHSYNHQYKELYPER